MEIRDDEWRDLSDASLLIAIGRRAQAALAEVYERHADVLYGYARRLTSSEAVAEDVIQEVFLRLWHHPEKFDPERSSLRSFLLAQAHGRAIDLSRSESARRKREEKHHKRFDVSKTLSLEANVENLLLAEEVRRAMAVLPESQQKALRLAYFEGRTYREVATILGQPEGTVKARIRAGLRRLRQPLLAAGL